jgi:hypothetical protein
MHAHTGTEGFTVRYEMYTGDGSGADGQCVSIGGNSMDEYLLRGMIYLIQIPQFAPDYGLFMTDLLRSRYDPVTGMTPRHGEDGVATGGKFHLPLRVIHAPTFLTDGL